jgi:hypothetical protein
MQNDLTMHIQLPEVPNQFKQRPARRIAAVKGPFGRSIISKDEDLRIKQCPIRTTLFQRVD